MFVGLLGPVCSGKSTFAQILKMFYKFKIINLVELFELRNDIDIEEYIHSTNSSAQMLPALQTTKDTVRNVNNPEEEPKQDTKEETKEIKKNFCIDYYLNDDFKSEVDEIIELAIKVIKEDWKSNYVIYPIPSMDQMKSISFRHTFIMYEIEAPIYADNTEFEEFATIDDSLRFETEYFSCKDEERGGKVRRCFKNSGTKEDLIAKILKYDFNNYEIIRPNWDNYFMRIAHVAATRSNCMKRSVGAVIVNPDKQIVATGYNGTTFGFPNCYQGGCDRCNDTEVKQGEKLDLCICIHAEENAILIAGRVQTKGCSIYVTAYPCGLCAKFLLQSGIKNVYYDSEYKSDIAKILFEKCGITVKKVQPFLSPVTT